MPVFTDLCQRMKTPEGPADDLRIERGTVADYHALAPFHYRAAHPGLATTVFRAVDVRPTVVGRYLSRELGPPIAGVLVVARPRLACRWREMATGDRYRSLGQRDGAAMVNREVRTISRVVIEPRYRGQGLAVRLVRKALAEPEDGIVLTEAIAAMGRVSPFFEQAGMRRYDTPRRTDHARVLDALRHVAITPGTFLSTDQLVAHLTRLSAPERAFLDRELRCWCQAAKRMTGKICESLCLDDLLRLARQDALALPVYYAHLQPAPRVVSPE
jgi:GNAT superfamily N-acetyltransferase